MDEKTPDDTEAHGAPVPEQDLRGELAALRAEIAALRGLALVRQYERPWRIGAFGFLRGLAFGLGSALGATLLVALVVRLLGTIDFIPILGDWAQRIIEQIEPPAR